MKTKAGIIAMVIVLLFAGALVSLEMRGRSAPEPGGAEVARAAFSPPGPPEEAAPPGAPVEGQSPVGMKVIWRTSGEPARDAAVTLSAARGLAAEAEARAGDDGALVLEAPPAWRSAWIEARHPHAVPEGIEVRLPAAEPITLSLLLDAITGVVLDAENGEPIPGAVVRLKDREAVADEAGAYVLAVPGPGLHQLEASAAGHAKVPAQLNHPGPGESIQDFRLDPAVAVLVTVLDEDGAPIAKARVIPSAYGSAGGIFRGDAGVDTDPLGQARLEDVSRLQPPVIQAWRDGYRAASARPQPGAAGEPMELKLVLERVKLQTRVIAGRVMDRQGRPIPGAVVEWKDGQGTSFGDGVTYGDYRAVTDRSGRYRLEYSDDYDRCHLAVAAKGWAPLVSNNVRPGTPEAPAEVDFTLEPGHWLRGRVLDDRSRPLAGARLQVMPAMHLLGEAVAYPAALRQTETDADGRFELEDLPGPRAAIRLRPRGGPSRDEEVEVDREIELLVRGYGAIRGRVTDRDSGAPVTAFTVRLKGNVSMEQWKPGLSFNAADGRFSVERLDGNSVYGIIVEAEGYLPADVERVAPAPRDRAEEVAVQLSRGNAVEGVVVDSISGAPLPGVHLGFTATARPHEIVELSSLNWEEIQILPGLGRTVTGPGGAFRFQEESPAAIILKDRKHRRRIITPEERVRFRGADGRLRIPLEPGESLAGMYSQDGRPAGRVQLRLHAVREPARPGGPPVLETHGQTTTDADGRFAWNDCAPGTYLLEVERKPGEPKPDSEVLVRKRIEVRPGEGVSVEFSGDLGRAVIRGRVAGLEGHVTLWANVILRPLAGGPAAESGEEFCLKTYRNWNFAYACPWLRPGKYAVEIHFYRKDGDGRATLPPIEVTGDRELDLEVPASQLSGEGE